MPPATHYAQRFMLFQGLYDVSQSRDQQDWAQLISRLSQGQQLAQRAQLDDLAEKFASGQKLVMDELRQGGLFLDWELGFIQLGLAVGNLPTAYLRLAEHYRMATDFASRLQRHLRWPLGMLLLTLVLVPFALASLHQVTWSQAGWAVIGSVAPLIIIALFAVSVVRGSGFFAPLLYWLPGLGRALRQYQNYHYVSHLSECIAAGFPIAQAAKQSARRMPPSPERGRFFKLAFELEAGQQFSAALLRSGIMEGVNLQALPAGVGAREAPAQLGLAIHQSCELQLRYWAASLPYLLLGLVPWVILLNVWFLGR